MAAAFGWDAGRVFNTQVYPNSSGDDSRAAIEKKFVEFLRTFCIDNVYIYRDQLRQNLIIKQYFLEVDMAHLMSYDEDLTNQLKEKPAEYLALFEDAVKTVAKQNNYATEAGEFPDCQVMLLSNANPLPIRSLDALSISKVVRLSGIIISASTLAAKATYVHIMCRSCRHNKVLPVNGGFAGVQLPRKCDSEGDGNSSNQCPLDPYIIVHDKSKFVDQQTLKLQETPGMVPVGELPRHLLLSADRHLTNKVVPGTRVTVTGIFSIFNQNRNNKNTGAVAVRSPYLRVVGMQVDMDGNGRGVRTFTEEEEEEFLQMSRKEGLYQEFSSSIAPSIYGHADIKKAITCLLFGGSKKVLPDGMRLRGDINVLLLGDPGTAKSQLLKFVEKVSPIGVYTSGKGSSAAGLTASVIRDPGSREFYLEGGAMVLADGGVVCIDEFDKMREEDRVAIHEAMEQQTISIAKAGITTILNSRTSVLAAANPVFGRYDDMKSAGENIDFQSTILSRFDLIFIVKDEHNESRDRTIARHVLQVHMNTHVKEREAAGDINIQKMRSYISYCKTKCAPRLTEEAAKKLSSHFVEMRSKARSVASDNGPAAKSAVPITVRQLEAIIRISESLAKLTLSTVATEQHVDEAMRLFNHSTMDAVQSGLVEGFDSRSKFSEEVMRIEEQIRRRLMPGSKVSLRVVKDEFLAQEFSPVAVDRAIDILVRRDVLQYVDRRMKLLRTMR
ncbi:MCM2/3/5 family-domain-containing protein [Fimicolochytrium jonesii]|uniref:MCM2/3/5 family-domain-containing protein n=1 Tax=Fimicolochytrium jonesii TaxID=1396493 RepID=UPI0022FDBF16|nr:MCM2/3/5 family-domain-containing protein [Fimicolochytrium jonesii]KAI8823127.1 MCM2/3/5 family-domain-containing protein [Fimicolochytrium jonesii]